MKYTIESKGDAPIEIGGVGVTKKGSPIDCSENIAREFSKDDRFIVTGLKKKKGVK